MAKQLSHQKTTSAPEVGWHQDPSNPNMQRYWDGYEWADMRFGRPIEEWSTSEQVAVLSVYVLAIIAVLALIGFLALGAAFSGY